MSRLRGLPGTDPILLSDADAELQRATRVVLTALAVDALAIGIDGRLPTGAEYRERFHVGAGTVQRALELLVSSGALSIASRGHLGRYIRDLDVSRLWHLGNLPPVRVVLPPRGPIEVRAIVEGLVSEFARLELPVRVSHLRGGVEREKLLSRGEADIAVVSSGLLDEDAPHRPIESRIRLPKFSYYADGMMLVLRGASRAGRRVAIDYSSLDQARLTQSEFPESEGFEYVEVDFPRVPLAILQGEADIGIWHQMQTLIPPRAAGLQVDALVRPQSLDILARSSAAELLLSPLRPELSSVVPMLDMSLVESRRAHLLGLPTDASELLDLNWTV